MLKRLIAFVLLVLGAIAGFFVGLSAGNHALLIAGIAFLIAAILVLIGRINSCLVIAGIAAIIVATQVM
jgi:galactitol-specific phosphotransferase system IIC component